MPDFATVFKAFNFFNEEIKERSITYNQLNKVRTLNIGQLIQNETNDVKTEKRNNFLISGIYLITRLLIHVMWTFVAVYMFFLIEKEEPCLVKWGFPKPYMVYAPNTEKYQDQFKGYDLEETVEVLTTLGDLYDVYKKDQSW